MVIVERGLRSEIPPKRSVPIKYDRHYVPNSALDT
jgi:hypothetical protein